MIRNRETAPDRVTTHVFLADSSEYRVMGRITIGIKLDVKELCSWALTAFLGGLGRKETTGGGSVGLTSVLVV